MSVTLNSVASVDGTEMTTGAYGLNPTFRFGLNLVTGNSARVTNPSPCLASILAGQSTVFSDIWMLTLLSVNALAGVKLKRSSFPTLWPALPSRVSFSPLTCGYAMVRTSWKRSAHLLSGRGRSISIFRPPVTVTDELAR